MGAAQTIKDAYLSLSLPERKQFIHDLIEIIDNDLPEKSAPVFELTDEMIAEKPWLALVGRWTKQEGNDMMKAINEADGIDED